MTDTMTDADTRMAKLRKLDTLIATLTAAVSDAEGRLAVLLAEDFAGDGDRAAQIEPLRTELARLRADLSEKQGIRPYLIDLLQGERAARRAARIKDFTERITRAVARQDECNREIAQLTTAWKAACAPLEQERSDRQDEVLALTQPTANLGRPHDTWRGSLDVLEALIHDEECWIRPNEIERLLAEWRAQEQREGCQITQIELAYETATGKITHARITGQHSKEQLRELKFIAQERENRQAQR